MVCLIPGVKMRLLSTERMTGVNVSDMRPIHHSDSFSASTGQNPARIKTEAALPLGLLCCALWCTLDVNVGSCMGTRTGRKEKI